MVLSNDVITFSDWPSDWMMIRWWLSIEFELSYHNALSFGLSEWMRGSTFSNWFKCVYSIHKNRFYHVNHSFYSIHSLIWSFDQIVFLSLKLVVVVTDLLGIILLIQFNCTSFIDSKYE